jgi:hypothetical protein
LSHEFRDGPVAEPRESRSDLESGGPVYESIEVC